MFRYIVRRLLQMVLTFFGATFIVYALMFANQDDPLQALAGERPITDEPAAGADRAVPPRRRLPPQYWYYMKGLLTGDFGTSLTGRQISDMLAEAWPVTIKLALLAIVIAATVAVIAGVISGIRRGGIFDNATLVLTLIMLAHADRGAGAAGPAASSASSSAGSRRPPAPIRASARCCCPRSCWAASWSPPNCG